jgi:hypothetical protein
MKRIYKILWIRGRKPEGEPTYVFAEEPRNQPEATHWIWWDEGFLETSEPNLRGQWLPCDQTAAIPVKRVG